MGWNDDDLYHQPEQFGLTPVGALNDDGSYEYDILQVWQRDDGNLYYAHDSGCSCNAPFEDFTSVDHATLLTKDNYQSFADEVSGWRSYSSDEPDDAVKKAELLRRVRTLLK